MTRQRVIAPVTFAHDSLEAAAVAADLAAALGAELVLAGISPVAPLEPSYGTITELEAPQRQMEHQRLLDQIMSERLEELADAMPDGLRCRTLLTWGPVGPTLVEAAREQEADLVVVPIRRERELAHLLHDRADRYVLHHSDVPVIVVPTNGRTPSIR
jgi:nucleotide-binding universal stress UspA family protein